MDVSSPVLPATGLVWQPGSGQYALTVVVKATFQLVAGVARLAQQHDPLIEADLHWDDDPSRSVFAPTDLVPAKRRVDVFYTGHAVAPSGQRAASILARLVVGSLDKSIQVHGDRSLLPDGSLSDESGVARMPILWERAAGGPGTANPVGIAPGVRDASGRARLPNIVAPGSDPRAPGEPAGLGPLAPSSPLRRSLRQALGAEEWVRGWALRPMPEGSSAAMFNAAPPDQQVDHLADDAAIILENLTPAAPVLRTSLPGVSPRITVDLRSGPQGVAVRADTLTIDGDRAIATVVWRGQIAMEHPGDVMRIAVELGRAPEPPRVQRSQARTQAAPSSMQAGGAPPGALPFAGGSAAPRDAARSAPASDPRGGALPFAGGLQYGAPAAPVAVEAPPWRPPPAPPAPVQATPPVPAALHVPAPVQASRAVPAPIALAPLPPAHVPPSPIAAPQHARSAALGGVAGASDAAADAPPRVGGARAASRGPSSGLRLLWHDADAVLPVRSKPEWKRILARREARPARGGAFASADAEDAGEMLAILAGAEVGDESAIAAALDLGFGEDGDFEPQLLLVSGVVEVAFDELETLRGTVATATPFVGKDDALRAAVEVAGSYLQSPGLVSSPAVARALTDDVRKAFGAWSTRPVAATHLDDMTARALLEKRAYQKREVFGAPHLRALLHLAGSTTPVPTYLPEAVAKKLPLYRRLESRLLVEVHHREDESEEHSAALHAVALARSLGSTAPGG